MNKKYIFIGAGIGIAIGATIYLVKRHNTEHTPMQIMTDEKEHAEHLGNQTLHHSGCHVWKKNDHTDEHFEELAEKDEDDVEEVETDETEEDNVSCRFITEDEYGEGPFVETAELVYFCEDGVLMDERKEKLDDPVSVIGEEALDTIDEKKVFFIRNFILEMDFMVSVDSSSYTSYKYGVEDQ